MKILKRLSFGLIAILMGLFIRFFSDTLHSVDIPKDGKEALLFATETKHDLEHSYLTAIEGAKKSILILSYSFTDGPIMRALRKKSEEGVSVFIITHKDISYSLQKRVGNKVKVLKKFGKGLMHLKIMVIDDETSFVGSANLTTASLKVYGNLVTAFKSESLASYLTEKALAIGPSKNHKDFPSKEFIIGGQRVEFYFLPDEKTASLRIKELIREAKKTIQVAMFTWTREDFAKEIIHASLRGVKTEIFLDKSSSQGSSLKIFELLKNTGVDLKLNKGDELLHYKFLYIDDGKNLLNGSLNWTKNGFLVNDDCFLILHDLTKDQQNEMNNLIKALNYNSKKPD